VASLQKKQRFFWAVLTTKEKTAAIGRVHHTSQPSCHSCVSACCLEGEERGLIRRRSL
jgi:hypothetical protein